MDLSEQDFLDVPDAPDAPELILYSELILNYPPTTPSCTPKTDNNDEDIINGLKTNIKQLKYKLCELNVKNKELKEENKDLKGLIEVDLLQNDNIAIKENNYIPEIFYVVATGLFLTTCVAVLIKLNKKY